MAVFASPAEILPFGMVVVDTVTSMVPFWKLSHFMDRESPHLSVESMGSEGLQSVLQ